MISEKQVEIFLFQQLEKLVAEDFSTLRQIPDTRVWKVVDYVKELSGNERNALFAAFVTNGLFLLFPDRDRNLHASQRDQSGEFRRFRNAMPLRFDYKYMDVRTLRSLWGDLQSKKRHQYSAETPIEVLAQARHIKPTNAVAIRKVVRQAFEDRFAARLDNDGGGYWNYFGRFQQRDFKVCIDYGGKTAQLRYEVFYEDSATRLSAACLTYEGMLGFGSGDWNYLTAANLNQAVVYLCDLIQELVTIPDRLVTIAKR